MQPHLRGSVEARGQGGQLLLSLAWRAMNLPPPAFLSPPAALSSSPFQGRLELFSLRIPSSSLWNAGEERGCSRGDGVHVHVCTHVCVCWGAVPHTPSCKNREHSESPKPQDPTRKSKALNIWSWGVTRQRSPGTHLTEDGGWLTARWNVKVEVSPSQPFVCSPNIYGASFLAGWCWTPGQAGRQGTG